MITLKAHYDGKTIVPDEPHDLPINRQLQVIVLDSVLSQANRLDAATPAAGKRFDFSHWLGLGLPLPANHVPRFTSNDQLWEKDK